MAKPKLKLKLKLPPKKILLILIPVLLLIAAALVYVFVFSGKIERTPKSPDAYVINENSAPSLDLFLGTAEGTLIKIDKPTKEDPDHYTYYYDHVLDAKGTAQTYYSQLILPEQGFTLVDQTLLPIETPDFDNLTGENILVRPAIQEGQLFRIITAFTSEQVCTVDVSCIPGSIQTPPEPEEPEVATLVEQVDHMLTYTPAQLGLEGSDLHEYKVFPVEGIMSVDGRACRQFNVYEIREAEKNVCSIVGTYLLTLDLQELYQLDPNTGCAALVN